MCRQFRPKLWGYAPQSLAVITTTDEASSLYIYIVEEDQMKEKRLTIAVDEGVYNAVEAWAENEYRPVAAMTRLLIMEALKARKAKEDCNA